ncbi:Uncharacterised protein [Mycobacteroides abscessus subsp. abscessus]|nr:Uncharacterised protein [Mycobacteroides abscessus subsp. abscessus]
MTSDSLFALLTTLANVTLAVVRCVPRARPGATSRPLAPATRRPKRPAWSLFWQPPKTAVSKDPPLLGIASWHWQHDPAPTTYNSAPTDPKLETPWK